MGTSPLLDPGVVRRLASSVPLDVLVCTDATLAADARPLFDEVHLLDPAGLDLAGRYEELIADAGVALRAGAPSEELEAIGAEMTGRRVAYIFGPGFAPGVLRRLPPGSVMLAATPPLRIAGGLVPPAGSSLIGFDAGVAIGPAVLGDVLGPLLGGGTPLEWEPITNGIGANGAGGAAPDDAVALRAQVIEREGHIEQLGLRVEELEAKLADLHLVIEHGGHPNRVLHQLRRVRARLRPITGNRLGLLWHHHPKQMGVPAAYREATPPSPSPSFSIVVPSYNQGDYIGRTLDSVLEQGYPGLELIVEDGASTDDTRRVLHEYEGRLASVTSEPDDGQADAINKGFAKSNGELMGWLNSDDLLLPGTLPYVATYFAAHPDVDVVYGHRVLIDGEDGEIGRWAMPEHDDEILSWADYVPQETLFWRREIWEKSGGSLDATFRFALDWDLLLRFRDAGANFVRLPRYLGAFRVHESQKSSAQVSTIGRGEMDRLRRRVHGHRVSPERVQAAIKPYLRRHRWIDRRQRLGLARH